MSVESVIGLTGPFGSGCSTVTTILKEHRNYLPIGLSEFIKNEWARRNGKKEYGRGDLQTLGNSMRREANAGVLADLVVKQIENAKGANFAIDGIRNRAEIETLRHRFGRRFFVFALECQTSQRFGRLQPIYKDDWDSFNIDDERDQNEEDKNGQQVGRCVDAADVLIVNDDEVTLTALRKKVVDYVDLVTGRSPRYARPDEILMNIAYSAGHGSKCLKRQVGAVIVNAPPLKQGDVVGLGYNENPPSTFPCVEEPNYGATATSRGRCYRDIHREHAYEALVKQKASCPQCRTPLAAASVVGPPWRCSACHVDLDRYFFPERAMTVCTAIHAEVAALFAAGERAKGATLYTTTFPCFQCAIKITRAGIAAVIYTEPYADVAAAARLQIAEINVRRFEGIRSSRFDEIFAPAREHAGDTVARG